MNARKQSKKPNRKLIEAAKMVLRGWGSYSGKVTPHGHRAISEAAAILRRAYPAKAGKK